MLIGVFWLVSGEGMYIDMPQLYFCPAAGMASACGVAELMKLMI